VTFTASSLFVGSVFRIGMVRNGSLRRVMAHRPPDLVAIFRAVSNPRWCVWFGRTAVPSRCVSWLLSLLHCPGHSAAREIAMRSVSILPTSALDFLVI